MLFRSQVQHGQFEAELVDSKPATTKATQAYENEKRSVMVEQPESNTAFGPVEQAAASTAWLEIMPAIGTDVLLTNINEAEAVLKPDRRPSLTKAEVSSYGSVQGVQVSQVLASDAEQLLKGEEKHHAKVQLNTAIPITVEETITADKPDKYHPELFVPTEAANKSFVQQNALTTTTNLVTESEGLYEEGAKRSGVKATAKVNTESSVQIETSTIEDSLGQNLSPFESPVVNAAEGGTDNLECVSLELKNVFEKESEFTKPVLETTSADVNIFPKTEVHSTVVIANEREKDCEAEARPEAKARVDTLELKPGTVTETIAHESEGVYTAAATDSKQAEFSLEAVEAPSRMDVVPLDSETSTEFQLPLDKRTAEESFNLQDATETAQVQEIGRASCRERV